MILTKYTAEIAMAEEDSPATLTAGDRRLFSKMQLGQTDF
jgi:hypothetical protein